MRGRVVVCIAWLVAAAPLLAQTPAPTPRNEAEQNVVNLSTTQSMRAGGHHFRITHRFARDWRRGTFGQLAADFFSLDSGAIIGLDYRFAPTSRIQAGIYRSMLFKTIQLSGRVDAWQQGDTTPLGLSVLVSVEGANNLQDDHAPGLGIVTSRSFGEAVTFYASPMFVWNTAAVHQVAAADGHDHGDTVSPLDDGYDDTAVVGL